MDWTKWLSLIVLVALAGCASQSDTADMPDEDVISSAEIVDDAAETVGSPSGANESPADMFNGLKATYEKQMKDFRTAIEVAEEKDRRKVYDEKCPKPLNYASEFMYIADTHPDSQAAVDSLFWVAQNTRGLRTEKVAVDRLFENHIDAKEMVQFCFQLLYAKHKSENAESRLKRLIDESPHRQVQGIATYCLASFLRRHEQEDENKEKYVELFNTVVANYEDVRFRDRPIAKMAEGALFEIEHLTVGATVPDIEAEDLDGKPFKLSEYRGKVVMLSFWGDWCVQCRSMYPHERSLVKKLADKPFALIGVNSDRDLENIREIVKEKDISWRSFWNGENGVDGPISTKWNVISWPAIYIIDHEGVIRYKSEQRGKKLDQSLTKLLADMGHEVDLTDHSEQAEPTSSDP